MITTFAEVRLGLTHKRPSYRPTGTHHSPRSVLEWESAIKSSSLSSTSRPTLCTHSSLTANTATSHWVVTRGRIWLVYRPPCRLTVTRKASMLCVLLFSIQKQESGSMEIMKTTAIADSRIGFGTGGKHDDNNTCGNEAKLSSDNGDKHIKAMGYILVQWRGMKQTFKRAQTNSNRSKNKKMLTILTSSEIVIIPN